MDTRLNTPPHRNCHAGRHKASPYSSSITRLSRQLGKKMKSKDLSWTDGYGVLWVAETSQRLWPKALGWQCESLSLPCLPSNCHRNAKTSWAHSIKDLLLTGLRIPHVRKSSNISTLRHSAFAKKKKKRFKGLLQVTFRSYFFSFSTITSVVKFSRKHNISTVQTEYTAPFFGLLQLRRGLQLDH